MLGSLALAMCGLVGCKKHEHTFATEWSKNETEHWHAATCEHTEEVADKAAHTWNEGEVTTPATFKTEGVKTFTCTACGQTKTEPVAKTGLPAARLEGKTSYNYTDSGVQLVPGETGAKKAIEFFDSPDIVYIDARDMGAYLQGHIEGFENLPFFDFVSGTAGQLFTVDGDTVKANYEESVQIMKSWIPTDKVVFLMCQSGGRIVNFMKILQFCGYDMAKIYNIGGWNQIKAAGHEGYTTVGASFVKSGNGVYALDATALTPATITTPAAKVAAVVPAEQLPAARLEGKTSYNYTDSGVQLVPGTTGAKKAIELFDLEDAVYIDARDLGAYLQGHVEGFENLPFFDFVNGSAGQLFTVDGDTVKANYEESVQIMKSWIPTDKVVFLMCQSGGRIVNFMKVLEFCGYDMAHVYNIGGWNQIKAAGHEGYTTFGAAFVKSGNGVYALDATSLTPVVAA